MKHIVFIALIIVVIACIIYQYYPLLFAKSEGFQNGEVSMAGGAIPSGDAHGSAPAGVNALPGALQQQQNSNSPPVNPANKNGNPQNTNIEYKRQPKAGEGFADLSAYQGPAQLQSAEAPAGCYPRDQLTPSELLPKDMSSVWAEQNPMGPGSLKGKNFLSAGALIGVNTVGQSMRNANLQVRSEPPNPQQAVSIFNQSTISPDISHRPLEIGA